MHACVRIHVGKKSKPEWKRTALFKTLTNRDVQTKKAFQGQFTNTANKISENNLLQPINNTILLLAYNKIPFLNYLGGILWFLSPL